MPAVDFERIARAALARAPDILSRWLPDGRNVGREYLARNPRRADHKPGSFSVNLDTGLWCDFATGDRGRDLIALAAYLGNIDQRTAALRVAEMLGVDPHER